MKALQPFQAPNGIGIIVLKHVSMFVLTSKYLNC